MKKIIKLVVSILLCIALLVLGLLQGFHFSEVQKETLLVLGIICGISVLYCFIAGEISRNNSQMDKLWSILPIVYVWFIAGMGQFRIRLIIIAVLVTIWGGRLTYNFAKKGAYSWKFWSGEEDYRWIYLRKQKPLNNKVIWGIFDFGFISLWQNIVVLGMTLPAVAIMESDAKLGVVDIFAAVFMLGFFLLEFFADRQQNKFQVKKYSYLNKGMKLNELPEPYNRGFNTSGLWAFSRHPNYLGEQGFWVSLYVFVIGAGIATWGIFNWSIAGSMLLLLIFIGSSRMAEGISVNKYPEYKVYQEQVLRYLPIKKYKGIKN